MMSGREDGLPHPVSGTQEYLAAILAELRGVRAILTPPAPAEAPAAEPAPALVQVREPAVAVTPGDEPMPVAAPTVHKPVAPPAAKARTTRKRTARKKAR